jgi:hypothetical protein
MSTPSYSCWSGQRRALLHIVEVVWHLIGVFQRGMTRGIRDSSRRVAARKGVIRNGSVVGDLRPLVTH